MPGCIRDDRGRMPWVRPVISITVKGPVRVANVDPAYLNELTYLLESGSKQD